MKDNKYSFVLTLMVSLVLAWGMFSPVYSEGPRMLKPRPKLKLNSVSKGEKLTIKAYADPMKITKGAKTTVIVKVLSSKGKPVVGATVKVAASQDKPVNTWIKGRTNKNGVFKTSWSCSTCDVLSYSTAVVAEKKGFSKATGSFKVKVLPAVRTLPTAKLKPTGSFSRKTTKNKIKSTKKLKRNSKGFQKTSRTKNLTVKKIRWSEPKMGVPKRRTLSVPASGRSIVGKKTYKNLQHTQKAPPKVSVPALGKPVTKKKSIKKFQLAKDFKKKIKVFKRKPLEFKRFEVKDPETGKKIDPNKMLKLPNGLTVSAGDYYDSLNKYEKSMNDLGYTLDLKRDPEKKITLQKVQLDSRALRKIEKQALKIKKRMKKHQHKNLPAPQGVKAFQKSARKNISKRKKALENFKKLQTEKRINQQTSMITKWFLPYAYASSEDDDQQIIPVLEVEIGGEKVIYGDEDLFAIFFNAGASLYADDKEIKVDCDAAAGGILLGKNFELISAVGRLYVPRNGGFMTATLDINILGESMYPLSAPSVEVSPDLSNIKFLDFSSSEDEMLSWTFDESYETSIPFGPFYLALRIGVRASAGIEYGFYASPASVNAYAGPSVASYVYAQAGIDIIVAEAGVRCALTLLDSSLVVENHIDLAEAGNYSIATYKIYADFEALSGNIGLYACCYVPAFDLPPWDKKCWDSPIFDWEGFYRKGYLEHGSAENKNGATITNNNDNETLGGESGGGVSSVWKLIGDSGTGSISPIIFYGLKNNDNNKFIKYDKRTYGINLGWRKNDEPKNIKFVREGSDKSPIKYGEPVAIKVKKHGYLRYKKRDNGILGWSKEPKYEWILEGNKGEVKIGEDITLYNTVKERSVLFGEQTYGINLVWSVF